MKKLFLAILTVALVACFFALGVSAAGADSDSFADVPDTIDGVSELAGFGTTERVVLLGNDGKYYTYPTYYIMSGKTTLTFAQNKALNLALGYDENMSAGDMVNKIVRIEIPTGVTFINQSQFSGKTNLKYCKMPDTVTGTGVKVFQSTKSLETLILSNKITSIQNDFCKDCSSLTAIVIPEGVKEVRGYAFSGCNKLASVTNNSTVLKELHGSAFAGCPMTEFKNTDALVSIGDYAFSGAKFTEIYLPNTITTLGAGAFQGCTNLTYIRVPEKVTQIPHDFIKNIHNSIVLVIPKGCTSLNSGYSLGNCTIGSIIFTGTEDSEFMASMAEKAKGLLSKVVYGNHCEYYYDNVHNETDNPCVINCERCGNVIIKENPQHALVTTITYASFDVNGEKVVDCTNEGCPHNVKTVANAMFTVVGESVCLFDNGVSVTYKVDKDAIKDYTETLNVTFKYGVFAINYDNIGENGILESEKVLSHEVSQHGFDMFEIKLTGFATEREQTAKISMGAYVTEINGEKKSTSYIQSISPNEGEKYSYIVFADLAKEAI